MPKAYVSLIPYKISPNLNTHSLLDRVNDAERIHWIYSFQRSFSPIWGEQIGKRIISRHIFLMIFFPFYFLKDWDVEVQSWKCPPARVFFFFTVFLALPELLWPPGCRFHSNAVTHHNLIAQVGWKSFRLHFERKSEMGPLVSIWCHVCSLCLSLRVWPNFTCINQTNLHVRRTQKDDGSWV